MSTVLLDGRGAILINMGDEPQKKPRTKLTPEQSKFLKISFGLALEFPVGQLCGLGVDSPHFVKAIFWWAVAVALVIGR